MARQRSEPVNPGPSPAPLLEHLLRFGRLLGSQGVPVSPAGMIDLCRGLAVIDLGRRADVQATARTLLVRHRDHLETFDRVFARYFDQLPFVFDSPGAGNDEPAEGKRDQARPGEAGQRRAEETVPATSDGKPAMAEHVDYSAAEALRERDFGDMSESEARDARRAIVVLLDRFRDLRGRRQESTRDGRVPDLRRLLRETRPPECPPGVLRYLGRRPRKPRLVLLCDVSGSMERYSAFLIQFMCGLRMELSRVDIGVFATRLMMVTRLLDRRHVARSVHELARRVTLWGSGTDIGASLRAFNDGPEGRIPGRRTVVMILSDGWDRGDAGQMLEQMRCLRGTAHRVIWLNPLLGRDGYEPLCRGMRTALPWIDHFLPAHNIRSLEQAARVIARAAH